MENNLAPQQNQENSNSKEAKFPLRALRSWVGSNLRRLFQPPRLPGSLILFALVVITTDTAITLMQQTPEYWINHRTATASLIAAYALVVSPYLYLGLYLIYLLVASFGLRLLNRRISIIAWVVICSLHLMSVVGFLECGINRIIEFSSNACGSVGFGLSTMAFIGIGLVLSGALEGIIQGTQQPILQEVRKMGRNPWIIAPLGLWLLLLISGVIAASRLPSTGWLPIVTEHSPAGRNMASIAYDTKRDRAVLFGGMSGSGNQTTYYSDTWIWNGKDWSQLSTQIAPAARSGHAMAYDEKRDVVVLFGGRNQNGVLNDTWEFDGVNWHQIDTTCSCTPSARAGHNMFYDPGRGKVVLYGGYDLSNNFYNDAWEWDGGEWHQIVFNSWSPVASGFNLIYDPEQSQAFGHLSGSTFGTWVWKDTQWTKLDLAVQPSDRSDAGMVFNPVTKNILLYGGLHTGTLLTDTWVYDGKGWKQLDLPSLLGGRLGFSMFFDKTLMKSLYSVAGKITHITTIHGNLSIPKICANTSRNLSGHLLLGVVQRVSFRQTFNFELAEKPTPLLLRAKASVL